MFNGLRGFVVKVTKRSQLNVGSFAVDSPFSGRP
jgi:hypothetical protein